MTNTNTPPGLELPDLSTLTQLQEHMKKLCAHFGWVSESELKFLLMIEEVGELAKAIRRMERIAQESGKEMSMDAMQANLEEEFADIFGYLLDLANSYNVDLGRAYATKVAANFNRSWKTKKIF